VRECKETHAGEAAIDFAKAILDEDDLPRIDVIGSLGLPSALIGEVHVTDLRSWARIGRALEQLGSRLELLVSLSGPYLGTVPVSPREEYPEPDPPLPQVHELSPREAWVCDPWGRFLFPWVYVLGGIEPTPHFHLQQQGTGVGGRGWPTELPRDTVRRRPSRMGQGRGGVAATTLGTRWQRGRLARIVALRLLLDERLADHARRESWSQRRRFCRLIAGRSRRTRHRGSNEPRHVQLPGACATLTDAADSARIHASDSADAASEHARQSHSPQPIETDP
jgi:hypothetical protein